jgi:hypothetical protein
MQDLLDVQCTPAAGHIDFFGRCQEIQILLQVGRRLEVVPSYYILLVYAALFAL